MYDKKYVKKRQRRTAAAITGIASSCGIGALILVAFLGRYVGTFTVTLDSGNVKLALSTKKDFNNPTSVLTIDYLPPYHECTYGDLISKEDILDSEDTDYLEGAQYSTLEDEQKKVNPTSLDFFKYTFYVKNVGDVTAMYNLKINIVESTPDSETGKRYLDDMLRVAVYENDEGGAEVTHNSKVYAKSSTRPSKDENGETIRDENGNAIYREYISVSKEKENDNNHCYGLAEEFELDNRVVTLQVKNFEHDEIKRYTILTWLEGEDPESDNNKSAPEGAKLKLGVDINAYENE